MVESWDFKDDGIVPLSIEDTDGQKIMKKMDLFQMHGIICDLANAAKGKGTNAWTQSIIDWLVSEGFPPPSHGLALHIALSIQKAVKGRKNGLGVEEDEPESKPDSPASTEPVC